MKMGYNQADRKLARYMMLKRDIIKKNKKGTISKDEYDKLNKKYGDKIEYYWHLTETLPIEFGF